MKYAEFLKMAEVLKPEEAEDYTELIPWGGSERVQINSLKIDETDIGNSKVKITAKNIILEVLRLDLLRAGGAGGVYMLTDAYVAYDPELRKQWGGQKRAEVERELADHKANFVDAEGETSLPTAQAESSPSDVPAEEAIGKQLREILEHNEWLKKQGRAEEQVVPF